jgi:hypothetical protein
LLTPVFPGFFDTIIPREKFVSCRYLRYPTGRWDSADPNSSSETVTPGITNERWAILRLAVLLHSHTPHSLSFTQSGVPRFHQSTWDPTIVGVLRKVAEPSASRKLNCHADPVRRTGYEIIVLRVTFSYLMLLTAEMNWGLYVSEWVNAEKTLSGRLLKFLKVTL